MAATIRLTPSTTGLFHDKYIDISNESAAAATSLLQKNHDSFHVFWNFKKYHNHQTHYLLTAYALGASPEKLQRAFDSNTHYQRPLFPLNEERIQKLSDDDYFVTLLGNEDYFHDFVAFFERRIAEVGAWQPVVQQYLFSRSKLAEGILGRLFSGESRVQSRAKQSKAKQKSSFLRVWLTCDRIASSNYPSRIWNRV